MYPSFPHLFVSDILRGGTIRCFKFFIEKTHAVISDLLKDHFEWQVGIDYQRIGRIKFNVGNKSCVSKTGYFFQLIT